MSWVQVNGHAPARAKAMSIINSMVDQQRPFSIKAIAEEMKRTEARVRNIVLALQRDGMLTIERCGYAARSRFRVVLPDGRMTPWPHNLAPAHSKPKGDEIEQARQRVEQDREANRRHWLSRERAPRRRERPVDTFFMDKATVLALQGISA